MLPYEKEKFEEIKMAREIQKEMKDEITAVVKLLEGDSQFIRHKINEFCRKGGNRKKMNANFYTKNTRRDR